MKVETRSQALRLDQSHVNKIEEKLGEVFPESCYSSRLKRFPRALAGEAVEYKTLPEKWRMKHAADNHDTARVIVYRRVKVILRAAQDRQELLWAEFLQTLKSERQLIVKALQTKSRRQRKNKSTGLKWDLEEMDKKIQFVVYVRSIEQI